MQARAPAPIAALAAPEPGQRQPARARRRAPSTPSSGARSYGGDAGAHRPARSQPAEARSSVSRSRFRRAGSAIDRHAHHPVAQRIDDVEMILERLARAPARASAPSAARSTRSTVVGATRRARRRRAIAASVSRRGAASSSISQSLSTRSFSRAERLVQLALQPEVMLAARVAGAAGDDDEQPLAAQTRAAPPACRRRSAQRQRRRQRARRHDQLAVVACAPAGRSTK